MPITKKKSSSLLILIGMVLTTYIGYLISGA